jgi:hypothetical protein
VLLKRGLFVSHYRFDLLAAVVVALLASGAAPMPPADLEREGRPNEPQVERRVEQRVLSRTEKITEQMKGSVCGTVLSQPLVERK